MEYLYSINTIKPKGAGMSNESRLMRLNTAFARHSSLPVCFTGRVLVETDKAVYVYGHGTLEAQTHFGACCKCGRALSHPGSLLLGIGPVCLGSWGMRDEMIRGKSEEEINMIIGKIIRDQRVDCWIPKSCIKIGDPTVEAIDVPLDHPKLKTKSVNCTRRCSQIKFQNGSLGIKIEFNNKATFYEDIANVKTLSGRHFHSNENPKFWTCPLVLESLERLKSWGFTLSDKLEEFLANSKLHVDSMASIDVPGLKGKLFTYQSKGVAFIEAKNGRALIADEMGLGKTVEALAWLQLRPEKRPALIVCPASAKLQWARMAEDWMPSPNVQVLSGTGADCTITGEIVVINYDILRDWLEVLQSIHLQVLILDEIHYIKNSKALRTKAVKQISEGVPHVIGLSGTPIENRPIEAYNAIKVIDRSVVSNRWDYGKRFCGAYHNGFGWNFNGATNTDELHRLLVNSIMIRRLKKDVLTDLPPKIRSFVPMALQNTEEYNRVENDFIGWVREIKGPTAARRASNAEQLAKIEALKQVAVTGKIDSMVEWVRDFIEIKKLVCFCTHKATVNRLMSEFGETAVKIDGSTPPNQRLDIVDLFQKRDEIKLFVGNVKAAGVAITLTASDSVAFLELPWTPGALDQAEDRVHRITQSKQVTVYYLLAFNSIEERIARMLDHKRLVKDSVLDGTDTPAESLLEELINSYIE